MMRKIWPLLLFMFCLNWQSCAAFETIKVYSYHLKPPLILDQATGRGLYNDVLSYLNKQNSVYRFELQYLPRRRLDLLLKTGKLDGLVMGVNPVWFDDRNEQKFLWSLPFMSDTDEIVSSRDRPFDYTGPKSMLGMRIGTVLGYYYPGLNELLAEGKIQRDDASSDENSFRKLMAGRVDAAIVSRSQYDYEMKTHEELSGHFYISRQPLEQYERHIMLPLSMPRVQAQINAMLKNSAADPNWQKLINGYR